jgi:hypothetical protein
MILMILMIDLKYIQYILKKRQSKSRENLVLLLNFNCIRGGKYA